MLNIIVKNTKCILTSIEIDGHGKAPYKHDLLFKTSHASFSFECKKFVIEIIENVTNVTKKIEKLIISALNVK